MYIASRPYVPVHMKRDEDGNDVDDDNDNDNDDYDDGGGSGDTTKSWHTDFIR